MQNAANRSPFGALLREFRLAARLSQEALAERAAMSPNAISSLERGINRAPQRQTLALLVDALALQPEQRQAIETAAVRPSQPRSATTREFKRHNLPRMPTPLFGRERDLSEVGHFLADSQVLTLIGAGGVGKTRLAVEAGYAALPGFPDGAWFAELAPARDSDTVAATLTEILGVRQRGEGGPLEAIVGTLSRKKALLILDNCEHIVAAVSTAVERISGECGDVRILATSRQPLQIAGERTYRVASLDPQASVALFIDGAERADASFFLEDEERPIVERICSQLDGIALAIELAAARVQLLSLSQLEDRLSERFAVLAGAGRPSRHQTMRALVDWSYDLLTDEEQRIFTRLGVFPAEFSLEAAIDVCSEDGRRARTLDVLGSLVDKSLLVSERRRKVRRFRLLETMRAYALEKLGAGIATLNEKHAQYYVKLVESIDPSAPDWEEVLEAEFDNLRRALDWSIDERRDVGLGVRLLAGIREFLLMRGYVANSVQRFREAVAGASLPLPLEALAWGTIGALSGDLIAASGQLDAAERAMDLYTKLGDRSGLAQALRARGAAHLRLGMFAQGEEDLEQALELSKEFGDRKNVMKTLAAIALSHAVVGRLKDAQKATLEANEMAREFGEPRLILGSLMNLAEAEFALGEVESAVGRLHELLGDSTARKNGRLRANAKSNLAAYLLALHRDEEARATARAAVFDAREAGDAGILSCAISHLAAMLSHKDPRNAARLLGYVESVFGDTYKRENTERYTHRLLMESLNQSLSDGEIEALGREGAALTEWQAIRLATRTSRQNSHGKRAPDP